MQKQTIALIDDDRNILTSLSIALEKDGFKVQTYIDGESRSEERRVGKECRSRWSPYH